MGQSPPWAALLRQAHQSFRAYSDSSPTLRHSVWAWLEGSERRLPQRAVDHIWAEGNEVRICQGWQLTPTLSSVGILYGPAEELERFETLASRAYLPLHTLLHVEGDPQGAGVNDWLRLAHEVCRARLRGYLSFNRSAVRGGEYDNADPPVVYVTSFRANVFEVSAAAAETILAEGQPLLQQCVRAFQEECGVSSAPKGGEPRPEDKAPGTVRGWDLTQAGYATYSGKRFAVSETEGQILLRLIAAHGEAVAYRDLARAGDCQESSIRTHLTNLRKKIRKAFAFGTDFDPLPTDRGFERCRIIKDLQDP